MMDGFTDHEQSDYYGTFSPTKNILNVSQNSFKLHSYLAVANPRTVAPNLLSHGWVTFSTQKAIGLKLLV